MNFELLGAIIAYFALLYSVLTIAVTFHAFTKLSAKVKQTAEVNLGKELILLILSVSYIIVYHTS